MSLNLTNIEWCTHTLNPVSGCLRNCWYCYAKKLHAMRYWAYHKGKKLPKQYAIPFDVLQYYPERLKIPHGKPKTIFVGSMSDIAYWGRYMIIRVIDMIFNYPEHTFMLLTKNPLIYKKFKNLEKRNVMLGVTFTGNGSNENIKKFIKNTNHKTFISMEPLNLHIKNYGLKWMNCADKIIVGVMTNNGDRNIIPKKEWINVIKGCILKSKILWKNNIKKYL